MPACSVSQLIVVRHAYSIPPASRASISVSGIRCHDDLRERASCIASGISVGRHRGSCRSTPNWHAMLTLPAPRGAMRRDGRADAISGRAGGMDGVRRCGRSWMMRRHETMRRPKAICIGMCDRRARTWQTGTTPRADRKSARVAGRRGDIGERIGEGGGAADGKRIRRCIDYGWQEIWESHQAMEFSDIAWQVLSSIVKSAGEMALRYFYKGRKSETRPAHDIYERIDSTR